MKDVLNALDRGEHLSDYALSRAARGADVDDKSTKHLADCSICSAKVKAEKVEFEAAKLERIPEALLERTKEKRRDPLRWLGFAAAASSLCAAALFFIVPTDLGAGVRSKGKQALLFSVMREGRVVQKHVRVLAVENLNVGDRVQVHLVQPSEYAILSAEGDDGFVTLYEGHLKGRDFPLSLRVNDGSKNSLHVVSCVNVPKDVDHDLITKEAECEFIKAEF